MNDVKVNWTLEFPICMSFELCGRWSTYSGPDQRYHPLHHHHHPCPTRLGPQPWSFSTFTLKPSSPRIHSIHCTLLSMLRRTLCSRLTCSRSHILCRASLANKHIQVPPRQLIDRPFSSSTIRRQYDPTSFPALGDTIYALSTAQGRAGIAVIRISGPSCLQVRSPQLSR